MMREDFAEELRFRRAADLLRQAAEAISAAKLLLEKGGRADFSATLLAWESAAKEQGVAKVRRAAAGHDVLVERLHLKLGLIGPACARLFLRLIEEPDQLVPVAELARAAGIRSASNRVIKVYICRLRQALAARNIPATAIETGLRGYSLRAALCPDLRALLMEEGRCELDERPHLQSVADCIGQGGSSGPAVSRSD